ncbi:SGNH/GDSL hydrolase family protein, partial [Campylobacter jejuni]|nr:SGNH/GDSL hydrolase family protein [Campylobacter jejuni]
MKYNVVLFGGSNSVAMDGLQKGLKQNNIHLTNLALGATTSIQNLYELKRERNQKFLQNADLIITESNVNELEEICDRYSKLSLDFLYEILVYFYEELVKFNKKVLIILLPCDMQNCKIVNNMHYWFARKFGFNIIDMDSYYKMNDLYFFHNLYDSLHPMNSIMRELGINIIKNIIFFQKSKRIKTENYIFKECHIEDLIVRKGSIKRKHYKNSMYNENVMSVDTNTILQFPQKYCGYKIFAIHTWNKDDGLDWYQSTYHLSNIYIQNKNNLIVKSTNFLNSVIELKKEFIIDEQTYITCVIENKNYTEYSRTAACWRPEAVFYDQFDLVGFFLILPNNSFSQKMSCKFLIDKVVEIAKEYDFNHLIPPIVQYKKMIDEYCTIVNPKQLLTLQEQFGYYSAKQRIKNQ